MIGKHLIMDGKRTTIYFVGNGRWRKAITGQEQKHKGSKYGLSKTVTTSEAVLYMENVSP